MKKLSIAVAALSLSIAAPVFACPGHEAAPVTAEKAKPAEPAKTAKAATPAKTAAPAKTADKVSQK
jgi:hypothetical protein